MDLKTATTQQGMDIIIVCHTEFGFVGRNKEIIFAKKAVSGVKDGVLNLVKIAEKYRAKITFAVCPETVEYFPKGINHEIGLHIHPGWREFRQGKFKWFVGDKYLRESCQQSSSSTILSDYSYQEQFEMIRTGKEYLRQEFDQEPKIFVAGRWSVNNDTVRALIETGFSHDLSAPAHSKTDHYDWSRLPRICLPYHPSPDDYQKRGNLPLLIVPISQTLFGGTVGPEGIPLYGLPWLKACFSEYYKQKVPLFHICLHSPSTTDSYYILAMDKLLSFISKHQNINFKFASEIKEYPPKNFKANISPYIFAPNKHLFKTFFKRVF